MAEECYTSSDTGSISLLDCTICYEKYGKNRQPKQLPCRHTFCQICLADVVKGKMIKCPDCRAEHKVPDGGVEKFPNDLTMQKFLEEHNTKRLQRASQSTVQKSNTTALKTGSQGAMSKETLELLSTLQVSIKDVTQSGKIFGDAADKIRSERAVLSETFETMKKTIKSVLGDVVKAANKRKDELLEELTTAYEESLALLTAQEEEYDKKNEAHNQFCGELKEALDGYTRAAVAPGKNLEEQIQRAQSKDESLHHEILVSSKKLSFNDANYANLLSDIKSWGSLQHDHCTLKVSPLHTGKASKLAVSDRDEESLAHYAVKERVLCSLGHEPGATLTSPSCVVELPNSYIAVTSEMSYEIAIFSSPQQKRSIRLAVPQTVTFNDGITGMCMTPTGRLCVSNPDRHTVDVVTLDGVTQYSIGTPQGSGEEEFTPWGITCNPRGELYVCDVANHLVRVLDASGSEIRRFGGRGREPGQFIRPTDVALMPGGEVVVADFNNNRIQVFDGQTGDFRSMFGMPGSKMGQLKGPTGVAVDANGFIAVSERHNNRVQVFTPTGRPFKKLGTQGEGPDQFNTPTGIAFTRAKEILVCDTKNDRVQIF